MTRLDHTGWRQVDEVVDDEDLFRGMISDLMGDSRGAVDIWLKPVSKDLPDWWLGSINMVGREEPSLDDIDFDNGLIGSGDVVTFFFKDPADGAHFQAQWS